VSNGLTTQQIAIYLVVIVLIAFRVARPQRISVGRMWLLVGLLGVFACAAIYESAQVFGAPLWAIAVAVVLGLLAGIPVGLLRGRHTQVSATDRPGEMRLGASWATALIYLGAFAIRIVIHELVPATSAIGTVVGDGAIIFAIGIVAATYYTVYRKYQLLERS
jgi:hypothetical protein